MAREDIAAKVTELLQDHLNGTDLEVYRITYKKEGPDWILRVFLDKTIDAKEQYVTIDDCENATRFLSDKLDELDFIDRSYKLEVSSPGMDRELITDKDFARFAGSEVEVKTYEQIDGSKNFCGTLISKDGDLVKISVEDKEIELPINKISKINLAVIF